MCLCAGATKNANATGEAVPNNSNSVAMSFIMKRKRFLLEDFGRVDAIKAAGPNVSFAGISK